MVVIGIDFGNESCIVSCVIGNQIKTIENEYFKSKTPSCVAFTERKRLIGVAAKHQSSSNVENTISDFKQFLGSFEESPFTFGSVSFFKKPINLKKCFNVSSMNRPASFSPVNIASMLLAKLKADANATLKDSQVSGCVLAVPSYFDESERKAFLTAAGIAKLDCHYLIKETTAIAINYSFYKKFPTRRNVFFIDIGHSAVQVFVCAFENEKLEVLAETSTPIGGRDIDVALAEHFIDLISNETATKDNKTFWIGLLEEVEKLKKKLSGDSASFCLNLQHLLNEEVPALSMDRSLMEQICAPLFNKMHQAVLECFYESGVPRENVDSVEIIGGSSRIPYIKTMIELVFKMKPMMTMNDEAVSRGCLFRFILSRKRPQFEIIEKTSEEMKFQLSDLLVNISDQTFTIQDIHKNFKDKNGYLSMTKNEFKALERTEDEFVKNEVNENLRYEARNKLERLVISYNNSKFLDIVSPGQRDFFINASEKVKFMHNKTKEEYENLHDILFNLIKKYEKKLEYHEEDKRQEQEREERKERERVEQKQKEQDQKEEKQKEREREKQKQKEQEQQEQREKEQKQQEQEREEEMRKEQELEEQKRKEQEREDEKRKERERQEQKRLEQKQAQLECEEQKRMNHQPLTHQEIETRFRRQQKYEHETHQDESNNHQSKNLPKWFTCVSQETMQKMVRELLYVVPKEPHPFGKDHMNCWNLGYKYARKLYTGDIRQLLWDINYFLNTHIHHTHISLSASRRSKMQEITLAVLTIMSSADMRQREKEVLEGLLTLKKEINEVKSRCPPVGPKTTKF